MSPDLTDAEIDDICKPERRYAGSPLQAAHRAMRAEAEARAAAAAAGVAAWRLHVTSPAYREQRRTHRAAVVRFHAAKRRSAQLQRTPPWADLAAIQAIYDEAQRLTIETGEPHHVDHDIPLQGELVSGLHVERNLQVLTGVENIRKRNRFEIEP